MRELTLNNILFIGNSYTTHGNSEGIWWGNGRGMAASVDATQYTSLIAEKTGAQITKGNYADFEINYSPSYNFSSHIPISNGSIYNLVVVQLFENAVYRNDMRESWEALYDYIKLQCPNASIIQIIGRYQQEKANAVYAAAREKDVIVLDCSDLVSNGMYSIGDYVTDSNGNYHAIENSGVAGHPSDIGFYGIASKILEEYVEDISEKLKNITISSIVGGSISVPFNKWVVGGVVNIRVTSGTINSVVVNNGSVIVTKRDNSHFTFIMM